MRHVVALGLAMWASGSFGPELVGAQCNRCNGDFNGDDQVTIDELVQAVGRALNGCADNVACRGDGDCDPDELCANGTCVGRPDPCTSNDDCDPDERCVDGNCL